jgi:IstB-like ATP binding protein
MRCAILDTGSRGDKLSRSVPLRPFVVACTRTIPLCEGSRVCCTLTSNRPVEDWGKLLGDVAAVSAMLDRLLHHGHVLKCGPRSWRTKTAAAS